MSLHQIKLITLFKYLLCEKSKDLIRDTDRLLNFDGPIDFTLYGKHSRYITPSLLCFIDHKNTQIQNVVVNMYCMDMLTYPSHIVLSDLLFGNIQPSSMKNRRSNTLPPTPIYRGIPLCLANYTKDWALFKTI